MLLLNGCLPTLSVCKTIQSKCANLLADWSLAKVQCLQTHASWPESALWQCKGCNGHFQACRVTCRKSANTGHAFAKIVQMSIFTYGMRRVLSPWGLIRSCAVVRRKAETKGSGLGVRCCLTAAVPHTHRPLAPGWSQRRAGELVTVSLALWAKGHRSGQRSGDDVASDRDPLRCRYP